MIVTIINLKVNCSKLENKQVPVEVSTDSAIRGHSSFTYYVPEEFLILKLVSRLS
jgi:hypothetical protein